MMMIRNIPPWNITIYTL